MGNALVDVMTRLRDDQVLDILGLARGSMQLVDQEFMRRAMTYTRDFPQTLTAGGSAANTINGLANLGIPAAFVGMIGDDEHGQAFEVDMARSGIQPILFKGSSETGRALVLVSPDSERTFATCLSVAAELTADNLSPDLFVGCEYFHVEGYLLHNHDLFQRVLELAHAQGVKISLDMASYNVVLDNQLFLNEIMHRYVHVVFANEDEARTFTGQAPEQSLETLAALVPVAVVKLGGHGSLIARGSERVRVGVIDIDRVDTTGAGDMYSAGFLYGMLKGLSLDQCGEIGAILSSYVIGVLGAKMDQERWNNIRQLVAQVENR